MSQPYKSGRQKNLNLGISSITENSTVLQTIGKVGIGTTNAQNHSLFVVGSSNITGNSYVGGASTFVGVGTFNNDLYVGNQLYVGETKIGQDISTRHLLATGVSTFVGVGTFSNDLYVGGDLYVKDDLVLDELTARNLYITGITTVGVVSAVSVNATGIITANSFRPSSGYIQAADGTNSFFIYNSTGNVAFQGTIGASSINNGQGYQAINFTTTSTPTVLIPNGLNVTGITTLASAGGITTTGGDLYVGNDLYVKDDLFVQDEINTLDLVASGLATVSSLSVSTDFDVFDSTATFHNNVFIAGNLSIGGTTTAITVADLKVIDKEIILGITTDAFGNDVSTDTTANHGGIAIASTEGFPLVSLQVAGINTLPDTYKQIMWVRRGTMGAGTTDAWLFNYAVGIGSTQVPDQTRLAVGEIHITDNLIESPNANLTNLWGTNLTYTTGNLNTGNIVTGVVTTISGSNLTYTNGNLGIGNIVTGVVTTISGTDLNYTGVGTIATLASTTGNIITLSGTNLTYTNANIDNAYITTGIVTTIAGSNLTYVTADIDTAYVTTGIVTTLAGSDLTYSNAYVTAGIVTTIAGSNLTYTNADIDNAYVTTGIITTVSGSDLTYTSGNFTTGNIVTGVITTLTSTNASLTNINSTGITTLGFTTTTSLFANQLSVSGFSTFVGVGTFENDLYVGGNLFVQNDLVFDEATVRNINVTGISTLGFATATHLYVSGVTTTGNLTVNFTSFFGGDIQANSLIIANGGVQGNLTGNVTSTGSNTFGNINVTGLSTLGISSATSLYVSGVSTFVGVSTFQNDLYVGGDLYVADDIVFDEFTARNATLTGNLSVTGVSTFTGIIDANGGLDVIGGSTLDALDVTGISTFTGLIDANGGLDVIGGSTLDALGVSGVSTFTGLIDANGGLDVIGGSTLDALDVTGISTFTGLIDANGGLNVTGQVVLNNSFAVTGVSTFTGLIDANGDLDVDGHTELDNVNISGVTTFAGLIDANGGLDVVGGSTLDTINVTGVSTFGQVQITTSGIVTSSNPGVTTVVYYGDGSNLIGVNAFNVINQDLTTDPVYPTFASNIGVASIGISSTQVVYIPSLNRLGIGTTTPQYTLEIVGNTRVSGLTSVTNLEIYGTVGAGNSVGNDGQYLKSTGVGVTWASFPTLRTTGITTATQGQTVFNFAYNVGFLDVYVNGVKLTSSEYVANNGSTIVLISPAFIGDIVEFVSYNTVSSGGSGGGGGATILNDLIDVSISTPLEGDDFVYDGTQWVNDYTVNTSTSTTSQTVIHTLSTSIYRSVEYMIQATQGTDYHLTKILAIHDGSLAYPTEYGTLYTNSSLGSFDIDISGGNMRLLVTPASSSSTTYKIKFTAIKA